jgi:hypothetical protein
VVPNPVDAYTSTSIQACLADAGVEARDVFTAQDTSPGRLVAFQRLAHVTGLAYYDQESFLCLHPRFGPWFALRAFVILPEKSTLPEPELLSDPTPPDVRTRVMEAFEAAVGSSDRFLPWVRLRDAVAPNHPFRYTEEQIRYHYLVRLWLRSFCARHVLSGSNLTLLLHCFFALQKKLDYFKSLVDTARDEPENDPRATTSSSPTVL